MIVSPHALFDWVTFLAQSLPARSVRTFIELLLGAMLTSGRLRHRSLPDVRYAKILDQPLQMAGERKMVVIGAGQSVCAVTAVVVSRGYNSSGYRRHTDSARLKEGVGQSDTPSTRQQAQPSRICSSPVFCQFGDGVQARNQTVYGDSTAEPVRPQRG